MFGYQKTALGKDTEYYRDYRPQVLCPLPRQDGRAALGLIGDLPFQGVDIWHNYEASWLNAKGKPQVAIVQLTIPAQSPYLIESKSLKLYFNSLNFHRFDSAHAYSALVVKDLSQAAGAPVSLEFLAVDQRYQSQGLTGTCLDDLDISCDDYVLTDTHLALATPTTHVEETVYSHLLRSNCPVTNQPDWGSVRIHYRGQQLDHTALLRYLISFREHNDFHEQCVERIFVDIMRHCQPQCLTVQAYYTRRGGLDINPFRSTHEQAHFQRLIRQ
ncbi:NADPH-dependent 7-cyano-7-deazaguanine reductase QueF [Agitococcus lubricus]|uniref:NADPH-dependent 7-cyano-7-deazaguanine reductase n=1 Tax=Agitococcus lubricus TaxID=1077255 RepID=A0A2T5IZ11_9GAMM|nr:NADPH-dependent 7-cyano-7-deazaguanine reductase QueF [Agitococcus lubricus]PTQ89253.1 7-cyano-7-deazaguanine reductase [Agitococcus lubricus]